MVEQILYVIIVPLVSNVKSGVLVQLKIKNITSELEDIRVIFVCSLEIFKDSFRFSKTWRSRECDIIMICRCSV